MATMNISLPDEMKDWVEGQVGAKFGNTSDFMRDLVRNEQERQEYIAYLNKAIEEGIASGFVELSVEEAFEQVNGIADKVRRKQDPA
jgi:antitoxin ParD1/3/4